jgi:hypothetical protein
VPDVEGSLLKRFLYRYLPCPAMVGYGESLFQHDVQSGALRGAGGFRSADRYNKWVVNNILLSAAVPLLDEIAAISRGIPAIAAFEARNRTQMIERRPPWEVTRGDR